MLRICDSKDLPAPVIVQGEKILYRYDERNQYLDQMTAATFRYLGLPPLDFNHWRDQYEINQMYFHERKKRTLAVEHPEIAEEWSPRNPDKPDTVFSGSPRKVWWHCPNCRQEYQATIASRTKNRSNCPFCANLRAYEGNCLATLRPEIAAQWHPELNFPLTSHDVVPGSEKEVYWKCPEGHVWKAAVCSRTNSRNSQCPVCPRGSYLSAASSSLWILPLSRFGTGMGQCAECSVAAACDPSGSGGTVNAGTHGRRLLTADFAGVDVLFAPENVAASFLPASPFCVYAKFSKAGLTGRGK